MHFLLRAALAISLALTFSMSAVAQEYPVRDIRKVSVAGDDSASATLLKRVGAQLKRSADATRRTVRIDRASMAVQISSVAMGAGGHNSAQVTVTLNDVKGGGASRGVLTVNSFMPERKGRDAALAEAIARRVAIAYHLQPMAAGKAVAGKRSVKRRTVARRTEHVVRSAPVREARPLVIPTEAALTVRSRALPDGATKKVSPCVVTRTISCD